MLRNTSHTHLVHEVWLHHKRAVGLERQLADVRPRSLAHAERAASRQHNEYLLAVMPMNGSSRERRESLLPHFHLRAHMASAHMQQEAVAVLTRLTRAVLHGAMQRHVRQPRPPKVARLSKRPHVGCTCRRRVSSSGCAALSACKATHQLPPASRCTRDMR